MPAITKKKAVEALVTEVEKAHADDLVEIHNELFPSEPTTEAEVGHDLLALRAKILEHIKGGLEVEEILDLWGVIFPAHRDLWYDEEKKRLHYEEKAEAIQVD